MVGDVGCVGGDFSQTARWDTRRQSFSQIR